ncbi:MAG: DNA-directed RNA polymerase subunit alpha [Chloroflexota bacterium]
MSPSVIPKIEALESSDNYAKFSVEPLEKGLGMTLGNVMRRILLGHLPGAAVARVKIEGIQHEFSTIPNVKEDAIEFLLNIKALRIKPLAGQPGKLTLDVQSQGEVTAADIKPNPDFEIVNPELHLATLDSPDARLYVELDVELGKGYKEAESSSNLPIGVVSVDAIFSPIRKVNFTVEPSRLTPENNEEHLYLEVWTDGTITPTEAISLGANTLIEELSPFVNFAHISEIKEEEKPSRLAIPDELANMPIEQLNLSVRTLNCLRRGGITNVGEIMSRGEKELMSLRNFGQKSKQELNERLASLGLSLFAQTDTEDESEGAEAEAETENPEDEGETS